MKSFNELVKNLKKDCSNYQKIRLALTGDSATQFLNQAIKALGVEYEVDFEIYESDFDQIEQEILNKDSRLYSFEPEYVVVYHNSYKLKNKFYRLDQNERREFSNVFIRNIETHLEALSDVNCKVIYCNLTEIDDSVFGSYSNKVDISFIFQLRKINYHLMLLGQKHKGLFISDISLLQNRFGERQFSDKLMYYNASITVSLDYLSYIAKNVIDIVQAVRGKIKKCVIVDLDNTLWGGIIGDDGIEKIQIGELGIGRAFSEFQAWLKQLKERGIILAVCSKNYEENAKLPFIEHPEMVLKLVDIAVFVANWESKVNNVRYIQETLNIGFDSMIFIDDNPYERNIVSSSIPEITVPELPQDPVSYLDYLQSLNLFETASYSDEDDKRTLQYQSELKRKSVEKAYTDPDAFLKSLDMTSKVVPFDKFSIPRVAQLSQRSNQFNLRTIRYTEGELLKMAQDDDKFGFSFTLDDKFGENGIVTVVILEKKNGEELFINTWIMSCRVLRRGLEFFVLDYLVRFAIKNNFHNIIGEYIPTAKNVLVKDHYKKLNFKEKNDCWMLSVEEYKPIPVHIKLK